MHQNAPSLKFNLSTLRRRRPAAGQNTLATLKQNKQNGTMEQNGSIFKSSDKNREVNVTPVRIVSAMIDFVCVHYFRTPGDAWTNFFSGFNFFIFQHSEIDAKMRLTWCKVRFKPWKSRQKSKIDHRTKRVLPHAIPFLVVADWKLGSRMDAPIFDFGRYLKFHFCGDHFNR